MGNLVEWIEEELNDEIPESVCIGDDMVFYEEGYNDDRGQEKYNVLLSWEEARKILDYEFDGSYGGTECHPVIVWTATKVIQTCEYDGAEFLMVTPRNPVPHVVHF